MDPKTTSAKLVTTILQGDASPDAISKLQEYLTGSDVRGAAYLTMAMPAYQLC
jgi:hypothetical protein